MAEHQIPTKNSAQYGILGGVQHRFERDNADLMLVKIIALVLIIIRQPLPAITSVLVASAFASFVFIREISLSELQQHVN